MLGTARTPLHFLAPLVIVLLLFLGCSRSSNDTSPVEPPRAVEPTTTPMPAAATLIPPPRPSPTSIPGAAELPIFDAHFHPDPRWDLQALLSLFDELGVIVGAGGSGGDGLTALEYARDHPLRFVPFSGGDRIRAFNLAEGSRSWDLQSQRVIDHLASLEEELRAGCWSGIGELFVNTLGSHRSNQLRLPADSPLMQRLWSLSGAYDVPLSVHMDADPVSVAEMERLLASDRTGTWIWAHSGWYTTPEQLRRLLDTHPNLYAELSFRDAVRSFFPLTEGGRLREGWRQLLEDMPERFLIGTDVLSPVAGEYRQLISYWRGVLAQLTPATAALIAHENGERLLGTGRPMPEACRVLAR
jgi:hypothetical protein